MGRSGGDPGEMWRGCGALQHETAEEIWGEVGRCGEVWGEMGRDAERWGEMRKEGERWGREGACASKAGMSWTVFVRPRRRERKKGASGNSTRMPKRNTRWQDEPDAPDLHRGEDALPQRLCEHRAEKLVPRACLLTAGPL